MAMKSESTTDIVERIRSLRYVHVPVASQLFEEAATEIERLRLASAQSEIARLGLSAEEWEAVEWAADHLDASGFGSATLRKLLKRLA